MKAVWDYRASSDCCIAAGQRHFAQSLLVMRFSTIKPLPVSTAIGFQTSSMAFTPSRNRFIVLMRIFQGVVRPIGVSPYIRNGFLSWALTSNAQRGVGVVWKENYFLSH